MDRKNLKRYPEEFKRQAVQLAVDLGNISKAARQLGVAEANLYNWKRAMKGASAAKGLGATAESAEEELKRLRKENSELKKVNHILKAASAIFTRDHLS